MAETTLVIAFIAGLVSFLSPCVLPLIPGFLSYLAGSSLAESDAHRGQIFMTSVFFVLGFSAVFSVLGVLLNTLLEAVAYDVQIWLSRIGGVLIILFGLYLVGLINKYAHLVKYVNIAFGVVLVGLGILAFTQQLSRVANLELLNKFLLR